mgnify:CR=1 FL=1
MRDAYSYTSNEIRDNMLLRNVCSLCKMLKINKMAIVCKSFSDVAVFPFSIDLLKSKVVIASLSYSTFPLYVFNTILHIGYKTDLGVNNDVLTLSIDLGYMLKIERSSLTRFLKSKKELRMEAVDRLNKILKKVEEGKFDYTEEDAHIDADEVLCDLLEELGYNEVVEVYKKIPKHYFWGFGI